MALCSVAVSPSPNQQLAVATVHYNPPNGLHSDAVLGPRGLRSRGHERKNSLPQMVAVPHEDIPKVMWVQTRFWCRGKVKSPAGRAWLVLNLMSEFSGAWRCGCCPAMPPNSSPGVDSSRGAFKNQNPGTKRKSWNLFYGCDSYVDSSQGHSGGSLKKPTMLPRAPGCACSTMGCCEIIKNCTVRKE